MRKTDLGSMMVSLFLVLFSSAWAQEEFGVSINLLGLARELSRAEIPTEVQFVLRTIEDGSHFKGEQ